MTSLQFALQMELDGKEYYLSQAENRKDSPLGVVFLMLASEEDSHAVLLRQRMEGQRQTPQNPARTGLQSIWKDMADFSMREKTTPDQVDVYRHALQMERQSIDLYSKLSAESAEDAELYGFLVAQEEEHLRILEQIVEMVNRPNEWVEAAEFGIRKEY